MVSSNSKAQSFCPTSQPESAGSSVLFVRLPGNFNSNNINFETRTTNYDDIFRGSGIDKSIRITLRLEYSPWAIRLAGRMLHLLRYELAIRDRLSGNILKRSFN